MWDKLTVGKFQQLYDIITGHNFDHELDRQLHLLACIEEKPVEHYESMLLSQLQEEIKHIAFLAQEEMPAVKPPRYLKAGKRLYMPVYDFTKLCAGQFIDVISIAKTPEEHVMNLNRTMAAICLPVKKGVLNSKVMKYGDVPFDDVADDMLAAPLLEVQAIANFFMQVWQRFLESMPGFLAEKMKTMSPEDREKWQAVSDLVGAGS